MRRSLISTTAIAALVFAPAVALAQVQSNGPSGAIQEQPRKQEHVQGGKSATPPTQMAPGKSAQTQTPAAPKNRMTTQGEPQAPGGKAPQRQQLQGQAQPEPQGTREHKAPVQQGQAQPQTQGSREHRGMQQQAQTPQGTQGQGVQGGTQQPGSPSKTTGTQQRQTGAATTQSRADTHVQVTQQQRTQIHERLAHFKAERIEHPQFSVTVGAVVPRSVHVEVLPPEIVEIVPEYQGFDYVLVGDEVLIIDPGSLQIVAVIPA
jgi:uncharacterized protein DUF1236